MTASDNTPLGPDEIVDALRIARERDVAPPRLHAQIRAMHAQRSARPAWRGTGVYAGAFATAVAAVVALVILVAPAGTPGAPTLAQAVALSSRAPVAGSIPRPDSEHPRVRLEARIGRLYFPNWAGAFGWRATGERVDRIDGRRAVTVFYAKGAATIAYTIVGAPALGWQKAPAVVENGVRLQTLRLGGRLVTTWRRGNNTCVLSSVGASRTVLQQLATW